MSQESVTFVDAASIAYWRSGEGPPLVLVHGTSAVAILDFGPRHLLDESPLQKPYLVPMTVRKLTTILVAQSANGTSQEKAGNERSLRWRILRWMT